MNRENKRKAFEKGYYKPIPAPIHLPARSADASARRRAPGASTVTTAPTAFPASMWT